MRLTAHALEQSRQDLQLVQCLWVHDIPKETAGRKVRCSADVPAVYNIRTMFVHVTLTP